MARVLMSFVVGVMFTLVCTAQWEPLPGGPFGGDVRGVVQVDGVLHVAAVRNGIQRSTDHGRTWTRLSVAGSNTVVLAEVGGVLIACDGLNYSLRSTDNGRTWKSIESLPVLTRVIAVKDRSIVGGQPFDGLARSRDEGATWEMIRFLPSSQPTTALAFLGDSLCAGTMDGGIFVTSDLGDTWTPLNGNLGSLRVAAIAVRDSVIYVGTDDGDVYRSSDRGTTWIPMSEGMEGRVITSMTVHGADLVVGTLTGVMRRGINDDRWRIDTMGIGRQRINLVSIVGGVLHAGGGFGLYRWVDRETGWVSMNGDMRAHTVNKLVQRDGSIFAATSAGILRSTDGGSRWMQSDEGMPGEAVVDVEMTPSGIVAGTTGAQAIRSTDDGRTWMPSTSDQMQRRVLALEYCNGDLFAIDHDIDGIVNGGLLRSTDDGVTWSLVRPRRTGDGGYDIHCFDDEIFLSTRTGNYRSADGGEVWEERSSTPARKLVSLGGVLIGDFLVDWRRSTNGGVDWQTTNYVNQQSTMKGIAVIDSMVIVGRDDGSCFVSLDTARTWKRWSSGLPQIEGIDPVTFVRNGDRILAGTTGRGIYAARIDDIVSSVGSFGTVDASERTLEGPFPNPVDDVATIRILMNGAGDDNASFTVVDLYGANVPVNMTRSVSSTGPYVQCSWDCSSLPNGVYTVVVRHGSSTRTASFVVSR